MLADLTGVWPLTDGSAARVSTGTDLGQPLIVRFHPDGSVTAGTLSAVAVGAGRWGYMDGDGSGGC